MTSAGARDPGPLEERIGHAFADRERLVEALTHVSARDGKGEGPHYQRLEFLGDRVLGLVVAEMLVAALPRAREGDLSRRLAELVRRETCAAVAREWGVGPFLRLGAGESHSGGADKPAILGDVAEAIIGAVFLDGGFGAARAVVTRAFGPRVAAAPARPSDAKTALQEWAQARGLPTPTYAETLRQGPAHRPSFVVAVRVEGFDDCVGAPDASKKRAAQAAAEAFLLRENIWLPTGSDAA